MLSWRIDQIFRLHLRKLEKKKKFSPHLTCSFLFPGSYGLPQISVTKYNKWFLFSCSVATRPGLGFPYGGLRKTIKQSAYAEHRGRERLANISKVEQRKKNISIIKLVKG